MKFIVTIKETLVRSYVVEAADLEEAYSIIESATDSEEISLDLDDFSDRKIDIDTLSEKEVEEGWWDDHPTYPPKESVIDEPESGGSEM